MCIEMLNVRNATWRNVLKLQTPTTKAVSAFADKTAFVCVCACAMYAYKYVCA